MRRERDRERESSRRLRRDRVRAYTPHTDRAPAGAPRATRPTPRKTGRRMHLQTSEYLGAAFASRGREPSPHTAAPAAAGARARRRRGAPPGRRRLHMRRLSATHDTSRTSQGATERCGAPGRARCCVCVWYVCVSSFSHMQESRIHNTAVGAESRTLVPTAVRARHSSQRDRRLHQSRARSKALPRAT